MKKASVATIASIRETITFRRVLIEHTIRVLTLNLIALVVIALAVAFAPTSIVKDWFGFDLQIIDEEVVDDQPINFTGALRPNHYLSDAMRLFRRRIHGPYSFAQWNGKLFSSTLYIHIKLDFFTSQPQNKFTPASETVESYESCLTVSCANWCKSIPPVLVQSIAIDSVRWWKHSIVAFTLAISARK